MKKVIGILTAVAVMLLISGCLGDDPVVGIQDSEGNTMYVNVLSYDDSTGEGTVIDTATKVEYTGTLIYYGTDSASVVTSDGDTLGFTILSIDTPLTNPLDTLPGDTTPSDTVISSSSTVVTSSSVLEDISSSSVVEDLSSSSIVDDISSSSSVPPLFDFTGKLAYMDSTGTLDSRLQSLLDDSLYTLKGYPEVPDAGSEWPFTFDDGLNVNYTIFEYTLDEGRAYVINNEMVILFPNTLTYPSELTGTVVDSAILVLDDIVAQESRTGTPMSLKFMIYGTYDNHYAMLSDNTNPAQAEYISAFSKDYCETGASSSDNDGLMGHRDPACGAPYGYLTIRSRYNYANMNEVAGGCHDWYKSLKAAMSSGDWVGTAPYFFDAYKVDPSENIDLHFTNNPFKWFSYLLYGSYKEESHSDLTC